MICVDSEGRLSTKLTERWHPILNGDLLPDVISPGSHRKVWWRCEAGHSWQAAVFSVVINGCDCPYCTGKKAIPGETDLLTLFPEIAQQLDMERNNDLDPRTIAPFAHEKLWWKCDLGHSWQAAPFSRTREKSSGCPYCTGRKVFPGFNDLKTLCPQVAREWYQPLNGNLKPTDVSLGSNKKVWWRCSEHHVWQAAIYSRTRQNAAGCPVCAGLSKRSTIYELPEGRRPKKIEISMHQKVQQEAAAGGLS